MIDTIVFRIHDITHPYVPDEKRNYENSKKNTHYDIAEFLNKKTVYSLDTYTRLVNLTEAHRVPNYLQVDYFEKVSATEDIIKKRHQNSLPIGNLDSSHYMATYFIDWKRDFVEFNFSIPKFLYGNNIAQFVEGWQDPSFQLGVSTSFNYQQKKVYGRFVRFMDVFQRTVLGELKLDFTRVELSRIDLCFNQFFQNKEDALEYLEYQKKITKKRSRLGSDVFKGGVYNTGVSYQTKAWSFKIYHKGTEYDSKKGDKKKHKALNEAFSGKQGNVQFPVEKFQKIADTILRYEITFRPQRISTLFRRKLFRPNNIHYRQELKQYKKIDSLSKGGKEWTVAFDKKGKETKDRENAHRFKPKVSRDDQKFYNEFKAHLQKVNTFYFNTDDNTKDHYRKNNGLSYTYYKGAPFTRELFDLLCDDFKTHISEYKIKKKDTVSSWKDVVEKYNENFVNRKKWLNSESDWSLTDNESKEKRSLKNKHPMNVSRMVSLLTNLQFMSLDEMYTRGMVTKGTFERWKTDLKRLGIDNRSQAFSEVLIDAPFNFEEYYRFSQLVPEITGTNPFYN